MREGGFGRTAWMKMRVTFVTNMLPGVKVMTTIPPKRRHLKQITNMVGLGNSNVPTVVSAKKRSSFIKRLKLTASAQAISLIAAIGA